MKRERPVGAFAPRGDGAANDRRADGPRLGGRVVRRHGQHGVQVGRALPGPRPRRLRGPLLDAPPVAQAHAMACRRTDRLLAAPSPDRGPRRRGDRRLDGHDRLGPQARRPFPAQGPETGGARPPLPARPPGRHDRIDIKKPGRFDRPGRRRRLAYRLRRPAPRREAEGRRRVPEGLRGLPRAPRGRRSPGDGRQRPVPRVPGVRCGMQGARGQACPDQAMHAQDQRQAERFIQTAMRERDCAWPCETSEQRAADFSAWMPIARLAPATRRFGFEAAYAAACGWIGTSCRCTTAGWCRELKPRRSGGHARQPICGHRPARAGHDNADRAPCGGVGSLAAESHIS